MALIYPLPLVDKNILYIASFQCPDFNMPYCVNLTNIFPGDSSILAKWCSRLQPCDFFLFVGSFVVTTS